MLTVIDLIAIIVFIFALWNGWRVGLFRSLLTPLFILVFIPIGVINYDLSKNFAEATLVTVLGGLVTSSLIRVILFLSRRGVDKEFQRYVFWGSRLTGSAISVLWKGFVLVILLLLLVLLPPDLAPGGAGLQKEILLSQSYVLIDQQILSRYPNLRNVYFMLSVLKNPTLVKQFSDTPEYQSFFESEKVKAFVQDESIKSLLAGRHFILLLRHPSFLNIISDDRLMAALAKLTQKLYTEKFQTLE
jgi:hypothetical protein